MSVGKFFSKPVTVASPENPVVDVVCLWEASQGRDLNGLPRRGLKGQVMFFTRGSNSPVAVNGDVKIYQFDNYGPRDSWNKPIHEFEFSAEQWNSFLQPGMLGPTYQLFIPYMRKHPEQVNVALQLRFTPRDGSTVVHSQNSSTDLIGVLSPEAARRVADLATIQGNADPEAKQAVIARTLGTIPEDSRADNSSRFQQLSHNTIDMIEHKELSDASHAPIEPRVSIVESHSAEERPEEPEPPRQQFRLSPAR